VSNPGSRAQVIKVSTDSLLASMVLPEGKYDVHRLDAQKLKRFTELLEIWRTRRRPRQPPVVRPDSSIHS